MLRWAVHIYESGANHPYVTGIVGFCSAAFSAFVGAVTSLGGKLEQFDDWVVRAAAVSGFLVSVLTIFILLGKVWRDSEIFKPRVKKFARWVKHHHRRRFIYHSDLKAKMSGYFKNKDGHD